MSSPKYMVSYFCNGVGQVIRLDCACQALPQTLSFSPAICPFFSSMSLTNESFLGLLMLSRLFLAASYLLRFSVTAPESPKTSTSQIIRNKGTQPPSRNQKRCLTIVSLS